MILLDLGLEMLSGALRKSNDDKVRNEQLSTIEDMQESLQKTYEIESSKDYLDTTEGKSALNAVNSEKERNEEALANNVARGGLTAEAAVAMGSEVNKNYSDAVSKLAAIGAERQSELDEIYTNTMSDLHETKMDVMATENSFWGYIFD